MHISYNLGGKRVGEEDSFAQVIRFVRKWLKDRKGQKLTEEEIEHYQRIVVAINKTIRIMKEIEGVIEEHGGWPER